MLLCQADARDGCALILGPKDPTSETKIRDCSFAQNHARMILA